MVYCAQHKNNCCSSFLYNTDCQTRLQNMLINVRGDQHTQPHIRKSSEYAMISLCTKSGFLFKTTVCQNIPKYTKTHTQDTW